MVLLRMFRLFLRNYRLSRVRVFMDLAVSAHLFEGFMLTLYKPKQNKKYLSVGEDTILDCKVIFESEDGNVQIGDRNYIGDSTIISRTSVVFENDIFVAWGCYFYDHDSHSLDYRERENDIRQQLADFRTGRLFIENKNWNCVSSKPIRICSNAWIGMNSIILKGVTIGDGAVVGAGSVVTKNVPAWTVVAGNPAVVIKEIPENLRKLK